MDVLPPQKPPEPKESVPTPPENRVIGLYDAPQFSPGPLNNIDTPVDTVNIKPRKFRSGSGYWEILNLAKLAAGALLLAFMINHFVFQSYEVFGQSMTPTLNEQDRLIISKMGKTWSDVTRSSHTPKRGEIIVFKSPKNPDTQLIKRVIGLPGERVVVENGQITVYNNDYPEGFNPDQEQEFADVYTSGLIDIVVEDEHLFVSGDNRNAGGSLDSRNDLGLIPTKNIVGKLVIRIFPFTDTKSF